VAANLADDAFGSFEDDKHDADDLGGGTHDWGVDDSQKEAAPNEAAVNKQQANRGDFDEENPKVLPTDRHATRAHLACLEACRCAVRCAPLCDCMPLCRLPVRPGVAAGTNHTAARAHRNTRGRKYRR
jgi:hypothetical protein